MWYLIIPPIIVVLCLSFVLWYLSRKGTDPLIVEKASRMIGDVQDQISFLRTKNFFLRILEKTAYRFKVVSLRMHNALGDLTQNLKTRRSRFQAGLLSKKTQEDAEVSVRERVTLRKDFLHRLKKHAENKPEDETIPAVLDRQEEKPTVDSPTAGSAGITLEKPLLRRPKPIGTFLENQPDRNSREPIFSQPLLSSRPMVSETMAEPEAVYEGARTNISLEENLIARIAVNPKDFTAYEGLGDHYLEVGNTKDAKECYRQVLKLSPLNRKVRIKIRRLENILSQKR